MKTKYSKIWVCTDPDAKQYGRQLTETSFEFKEGDKHEVIDLNDYKVEEIEEYISAYGYSLHPTDKNIYKEYGKHSGWIIAECLFEQINN